MEPLHAKQARMNRILIRREKRQRVAHESERPTNQTRIPLRDISNGKFNHNVKV